VGNPRPDCCRPGFRHERGGGPSAQLPPRQGNPRALALPERSRAGVPFQIALVNLAHGMNPHSNSLSAIGAAIRLMNSRAISGFSWSS